MISHDLIFYWMEISGFMSFPPGIKQTIDLNTKRLTAIMGENLDGGPGERNGAGKSAIIDALLYLYFGKSPRGSNQSFVNYIETGRLLVRGMASRSGKTFLVERGEKPSFLRLFEKASDDERDWYTKSDEGKFLFEVTKSKEETTKHISTLLGFDRKLTEVLLVNKPSERACYFLKDSEDQRAIQERIFGFTFFTEKAEQLKEMRREDTKILAGKESALIATRQANDRILREITTLEEKATEWGVNREQMVKFLQQQINTYKGVNFKTELAVLKDIEALSQDLRMAQSLAESTEVGIFDIHKRLKGWDDAQKKTLASLQSEITKLDQANAEEDIKILKEREAIEASLKEFSHKLAAGQREVSNYKKEQAAESTNRTRLVGQIEKLEKQLLQLDAAKCPTCGQDWAETKDHIGHCVEEIDKHTADIALIDKTISNLDKQIKNTDASLAQCQQDTAMLEQKLETLGKTTFTSVEEAAVAHTRIEELTQQLKDKQAEQNPHTGNLEQQTEYFVELTKTVGVLHEKINDKPKTFYKTLAEAQTGETKHSQLKAQLIEYTKAENPHRDAIVSLRGNALKEVDESEIWALKKKIDHMSLLIKLLIDKDSPLRQEVLNDWLPTLNEKVNDYLEILELPHRLDFDSNMTPVFKITVDERVHELTFDNLSEGQKLRAWLATNLAFREIFELINYSINLFFVDEVLDKGMSSRGAEVSYRLLEKFINNKKSVFLITHRTELTDIAENVITVTLENGLSTLH
jgi:DNA repair exonuclease SbcCD ATPase subunit